MPAELRPLARQLLRVVLGTPDVPDRDLLARFVATRDEDAFAEIVRRHGAMVLACCRRVTGRSHDADDAFQAAFLVLARRAGHVTRPELLANWLYGVAYRTALEARAARRRAEERLVHAAPEPASPVPADDSAELRQVIDEELARLPDKYRAAVVLCELEGVSRAAAAAQLGIPEGTLSSRLAHARKVLAERLTRRGVTAGVSAVGVALSSDAAATVVVHTLSHTTVHAAVRFVPGAGFPLCSGGGTPDGFPLQPPPVSDSVLSLTDGVLKAMLATRLKHLFGLGLLACGVIGLGAALAQPQPNRPADPFSPPTVNADPDHTALPLFAQPPKGQEPKKVVAKGVEDDDVPYGTFPSQAVARIEEGKLVVRQRNYHYEPVTEKVGDRPVTSYQMKSGVTATTFDPADIAVFDMKGNRLAAKDWKGQLKADVHVLLTRDGKLPNPRELTLFKADTLLIVLPAPTPTAPSVYAPVAGSGGVWYPPTAPPAPAVPALPPASTTPAPRAVPPIRPAAPALPPQPTVPTPRPGTAAPAPIDVFTNESLGTVATDLDGDLLGVSVGLDAGLAVGKKLDVYRDGDEVRLILGTLTVKAVEPKRATGQFTSASGTAVAKLSNNARPRKGDTVGVLIKPLETSGSIAPPRP